MIIKKISKLIEERRNELTKLLKRTHLNNGIRNQIIGAINEIDIFLRILNEHRDFEIETELKEFKLIKIENNENVLSKIFGKKNLTNGKGNSEDIKQESY